MMVKHLAIGQIWNSIRSRRETLATTRSRNEQVRPRTSDESAQIVPFGTYPPCDVRAAATPTNPRAKGGNNSRCIFARNTYPGTVVFTHTGNQRYFQFGSRNGPVLDFQNVDWDSCSRETEELRERRGEVGAGGEGIEGLRADAVWLGNAVAIFISIFPSDALSGGAAYSWSLR
jgi:hypothetical protein